MTFVYQHLYTINCIDADRTVIFDTNDIAHFVFTDIVKMVYSPEISLGILSILAAL